MPIYEYKCIDCGKTTAKQKDIEDRTINIVCECGAIAIFIPSIPAWRPDKTVR